MQNQNGSGLSKTSQLPETHGSGKTAYEYVMAVKRVIELINKMRFLQGYLALDYDDAAAMAAIWYEEFKRKHVPAEIYDDLVQKAFDHRVRLLQDGIAPPAFDLAELLSTFHGYYEVVFNDNRCDDCRKNYGLIYIEGQNNPVMCERPREEARGMRVLRR